MHSFTYFLDFKWVFVLVIPHKSRHERGDFLDRETGKLGGHLFAIASIHRAATGRRRLTSSLFPFKLREIMTRAGPRRGIENQKVLS
jgi:hypothetical protein